MAVLFVHTNKGRKLLSVKISLMIRYYRLFNKKRRHYKMPPCMIKIINQNLNESPNEGEIALEEYLPSNVLLGCTGSG